MGSKSWDVEVTNYGNVYHGNGRDAARMAKRYAFAILQGDSNGAAFPITVKHGGKVAHTITETSARALFGE